MELLDRTVGDLLYAIFAVAVMLGLLFGVLGVVMKLQDRGWGWLASAIGLSVFFVLPIGYTLAGVVG